jgi:hypothetical protein
MGDAQPGTNPLQAIVDGIQRLGDLQGRHQEIISNVGEMKGNMGQIVTKFNNIKLLVEQLVQMYNQRQGTIQELQRALQASTRQQDDYLTAIVNSLATTDPDNTVLQQLSTQMTQMDDILQRTIQQGQRGAGKRRRHKGGYRHYSVKGDVLLPPSNITRKKYKSQTNTQTKSKSRRSRQTRTRSRRHSQY